MSLAVVGGRLCRMRIDAELTGRQLAERLNWAPSKISRIEHGKQRPTTEDIRAWIDACGVDPAEVNTLVELLPKREQVKLTAGEADEQGSLLGVHISDSTMNRLLSYAMIHDLTADEALSRLLRRAAEDY